MAQNDIIKVFTKKFLTGTCFNTLDELLNDNTSIHTNAPRALIACKLKGSWRGFHVGYNYALEAEAKEKN